MIFRSAILPFLVFGIFVFAGCGKETDLNSKKDQSEQSTKSEEAKALPQQESPSQETPIQEQYPPRAATKKPARKSQKAKTPKVKQTNQTQPYPDVTESPQEQVQQQEVPPARQESPSRHVVGLGGISQKPEELLSRGYNAAILESNFCAVTGKFSNGAQCYAVFNDGKTEWASHSNRDLIRTFVEQLKSAREMEKSKKR